MDSLEINSGTGFTWWAEDMAREFKQRKGYDITPYLFLISGVGVELLQAVLLASRRRAPTGSTATRRAARASSTTTRTS